jgi:hypothetical protein
MKDFLKTVAGIFLFIIVAVGALTFLRNYNRRPSVILTSTECSPPCWYGIKPGQTHSSQVYAILDQLEGVNRDSVMDDYDRNDKHTEINWFFQRPIADGLGSVYLDNDLVIAISILTQNSLKLDDLFEKLGQPEQYWTEIGHGENVEYLEVILLNPTKGYLAEVIIDIENNANQVEIQGTTPILLVTYFAPEMFQELLETRILIGKSFNARTSTFQKWSGFGTIAFERK